MRKVSETLFYFLMWHWHCLVVALSVGTLKKKNRCMSALCQESWLLMWLVRMVPIYSSDMNCLGSSVLSISECSFQKFSPSKSGSAGLRMRPLKLY